MDHATMLGRLHAMLGKAQVSDDDIRAGVALTPLGNQKIAARLGIAAREVALLIGSLRSQLARDDHSLDMTYNNAMLEADSPEERFSYETDYQDNVTVRDAKTGKQVYLQGSKASGLLAALAGGNSQGVLARYAPIMEAAVSEADSYDAEIARDGGSYNYPWQFDGRSGFATVSFAGQGSKPILKLLRATDMTGSEIKVDPDMEKHLLQAAKTFLGDV